MSHVDPANLDSAGEALLDARTNTLAAAAITTAATNLLQVVRLRVGGEAYAIAAASVAGVAALKRLTPAPHAPASVAGLTALGGVVVPVFHLRAILDLPLTSLPEYGRLVLLGTREAPLALVVDVVEGTATIAPAALREPPATLSPAARSLIRGIDPDGVALLDADALLADPRLVIDVPPPLVTELRRPPSE